MWLGLGSGCAHLQWDAWPDHWMAKPAEPAGAAVGGLCRRLVPEAASVSNGGVGLPVGRSEETWGVGSMTSVT